MGGMNVKKIITIWLCVLAVFFAALPAAALDESRSYVFDLSANGEHSITATPGEVITVTLALRRTDGGETGPMYAMQDEICYDASFFEIVEGSALLYSGVETTDIALRSGERAYYMNFVSLAGGADWSDNVTVGSFQVRVLAEEGVSALRSTACGVSLPDGSDSYVTAAEDLAVIVTTECTVHFESNGGSSVADQKVQYGELVAEPKEPQREDWRFNGWYSDLDQTQLWDFAADMVKGNMTLYAGWIQGESAAPMAEDFDWRLPMLGVSVLLVLGLVLLLIVVLGRKTVEFDSCGGSEVESVRVRRGQSVARPQPPVKPGAVFDDWYEDEAYTKPWNFKRDKVKKNRTLYARWL